MLAGTRATDSQKHPMHVHSTHLRELRVARQWSQEQLAELSGLNPWWQLISLAPVAGILVQLYLLTYPTRTMSADGAKSTRQSRHARVRGRPDAGSSRAVHRHGSAWSRRQKPPSG